MSLPTDAMAQRFDLPTWSALGSSLFAPRRPSLAATLREANQRGRSILAEAAAAGRPVERAQDRRAVTQAAAAVQELWEALAPSGWLDAPERVFQGNGRPRADRRGGYEDWSSQRSWPFLPEDVVALVADRAAIERSENLLREACARFAAIGMRTPSKIFWSSVPRSYRHAIHGVGRCFSYAAPKFAYDLPEDASAVERLAEIIVAPWNRYVPDELRGFPTAYRLALRAVVEYAQWEKAAARGLQLRATRYYERMWDLDDTAFGLPLSHYKNPFEPLVWILKEGYIVADVTPKEASLFFPRIELDANGKLR